MATGQRVFRGRAPDFSVDGGVPFRLRAVNELSLFRDSGANRVSCGRHQGVVAAHHKL
jgi:hypothetical protein